MAGKYNKNYETDFLYNYTTIKFELDLRKRKADLTLGLKFFEHKILPIMSYSSS